MNIVTQKIHVISYPMVFTQRHNKMRSEMTAF